MAEMNSLPLWVQGFMAAYPYHVAAWVPARLRRPVSESRVTLVTTAGLHLPDQVPFHEGTGGDTSYREIPNSIDVADLLIAHKSTAFDQSGAIADRNLVFPLDRFRELEYLGEVGELNHRHWSFMGSIVRPKALIEETAPRAAAEAAADGVEVAFLTPA